MRVTENQPLQSMAYRAVTFAFGVLFVACAIAIFVVTELTLGVGVAGIVIGGLGLDAMISAIRSRKSLLARIGPVP